MMAASPSYFRLLLVLGIISLSDLVLALCANLSSTSVAEYYPESTRPATVIAQFVAGHNAARQEVGVPPLEWDSRLATFARVYAQQRRHDCMLVHSPGYVFGENIFWGQGRRWTATDVMASWVAEKQWYHYDTNSCSGPDCTHYTQIVWRTTKRVGCAKIVCDTGDSFAVCEYYPPGNYIGARPYKKP